jgi:hypothetical protein
VQNPLKVYIYRRRRRRRRRRRKKKEKERKKGEREREKKKKKRKETAFSTHFNKLVLPPLGMQMTDGMASLVSLLNL